MIHLHFQDGDINIEPDVQALNLMLCAPLKIGFVSFTCPYFFGFLHLVIRIVLYIFCSSSIGVLYSTAGLLQFPFE